MKLFRLGIIFTLIVVCGNVWAGEKINPEFDNISSQYAECAAYYQIVYHTMLSADQQAAAAMYGLLMEQAIHATMLTASSGRTPEMAAKVAQSRIEMYNKKMKQEAGNDNANISILINKYHFGCSEIMEHPEKAMKGAKSENK